MPDSSEPYASSTGQIFSATDWLDVRYELNRGAYETQVRSVGFQPGWRVLDAGCGSGSYLPLLGELIGPNGQLDAFDLDPANAAALEGRLAQWGLEGRVTARVGSVVSLPFPDDAFDAVWCANITQYLSDAELESTLIEFRRVVRPGGLVAVKESDTTLDRLLPAPVGILQRAALAVAAAGDARVQGVLRAALLPGWLRRAGLEEVRRHTTLIEHSAPLSEMARQQWQAYLTFLAEHTGDADLPAEDHPLWRRVREPNGPDGLMDDPDFWICEGNTLAVGRVPFTSSLAA
jgi:ubiquinone/menaquinone biosynthesis C-methylase UbiE